MSLLPNHPKRVAARARLTEAHKAKARLRIRFFAPHRHWVKGEGGWSSQPWEEAAVLRTLQAGVRFDPHASHAHDFASPAVAKFAFAAQRSLESLQETPHG